MNKSLHTALLKICTSVGDPLSHSCDDGIIARKTLIGQSIAPKLMPPILLCWLKMLETDAGGKTV
jgi:hypothetical protein